MTELTITQNGALYAMQHRAINNIRSAARKRAIAKRIIRTGNLPPESLDDRKIRTDKVCFI